MRATSGRARAGLPSIFPTAFQQSHRCSFGETGRQVPFPPNLSICASLTMNCRPPDIRQQVRQQLRVVSLRRQPVPGGHGSSRRALRGRRPLRSHLSILRILSLRLRLLHRRRGRLHRRCRHLRRLGEFGDRCHWCVVLLSLFFHRWRGKPPVIASQAH